MCSDEPCSTAGPHQRFRGSLSGISVRLCGNSSTAVLVCSGCWNEVPHAGCLQPQRFLVSRFWRMEVLWSRCGQDPAPSETCGGGSFPASSGFWLPPAVLGPGSRIPVSFSSSLGVFLVSLPTSPLCVCPSPCPSSSSYTGTGHIGLEPTPVISC